MPPETRLPKRSQEVSQRLESQKIETLVRNLESRLLRFSLLSANAGLPRRIVRFIHRDVILLLHALDELFDHLLELAVGDHLLNLLPQILIKHFAVEQRVLDGLSQV